MPGTVNHTGMPMGVSPSQMPFSRSAEFSSGMVGGGTVHTAQQSAPTSYQPASVLSPVQGNPNGESPTTYSQNRILNYYRS